MPGSLDSCINSIYEPGNIPASSGIPPVRVLLKDPLAVTVSETAAALDSTSGISGILAMVAETAAAALDSTDVISAVARSAMLPGVFINSSGTARQAMVGDGMVNL